MFRRTAVAVSVLVLFGSLAVGGVRADQSKPPEGAPTATAPDKPTDAHDRAKDEEDVYELQKLLVDTLDQVQRNYVRDISRRELVEAAIRGILDELDPYSSYIDRDQMRQFRTTVESEFGGIGITIALDRGQLKVLSPLVGTPAYRAGLVSGDRIMEIDGQSTSGITLDEAVKQLKGDVGSEVTLSVIHPGRSDKRDVVVCREMIHLPTVLGDHRKPDDSWDFMLDHDKRIGYIRITAFSRNTAAELRAAMEELEKEDLAGLILDLRFNPGGLLSSAIEVSDLFIPKGRIVSVEGRNSPKRTWDAHEDGTLKGFPMVVLVNRYSASASEIVAACLQDHHRAVIMGERTWGKGSVQNVIEMEHHQSALKLTTASYRRPSGKNIHRFPNSTEKDEWGVMPDPGYRLQLSDRELLALLNDRRQRDVVRPYEPAVKRDSLKPAAGDTASDSAGEPAKPDARAADDEPPESPKTQAAGKEEKPAFVDPHLRMAVDYLTGELARAE